MLSKLSSKVQEYSKDQVSSTLGDPVTEAVKS
jgi:hypothetical protein